MRNFRRTLLGIICVAVVVLVLNAFLLENNPSPESNDESSLTENSNLYVGTYDASRSEHDIGSCKTLAEDAAIVVFCTDDDVKSWDKDGVLKTQEQAEWVSQYLRDRGAEYGVELTLPVYVYASNESQEIRFNGTITTGGEHCDALSSIASNLGFSDKREMHRKIQKDLGMDQIAYIVAYSRDENNGNSFAQVKTHRDPNAYDWSDPEYAIICVYEDEAPMIMHEMLHTFGAQDFYRKEWDMENSPVYNEARENLAKTLCPTEVMLNCHLNRDVTEISDFTAYTIGWLDELPEKYDCPDWWIGTQWEELYTPD